MNFAAYLSGCLRVLLGADGLGADGLSADGPQGFKLSRAGLLQSFFALVLTLPGYYLCGLAIAAQHAKQTGEAAQIIPPLNFGFAAMIYSLTFSATIYIITRALGKAERFAPWVIIRHWAVFFCVMGAAILYGLYLLGIVPFVLSSAVAFVLYLATLAIDIRLAGKIGGFDFTASVFTACIIFAMGLSVLLIAVVQLGSGT